MNDKPADKNAANGDAPTVEAELRDVNPSTGATQEPLVLIHGFTSIPEMWDNVLPDLERRYDVHVVKLVGHYGGEPFGTGVQPSVSALVDAVEKSMDEAGLETAHIAGNSLGGWIAMELGARGRARSVVAMSPGGGWKRHGLAEARALLIFLWLRIMSKAGMLMLGLVERFAFVRKQALMPAIQHGDQITGELGAKMIVGMARCPEFFRMIVGDLRLPLLAPRYFDVPVIFLWGTKDRLLPLSMYADIWLRMFPAADWRILPGVGHITSLDAPAEAMDAIDDAVSRAKVSDSLTQAA